MNKDEKTGASAQGFTLPSYYAVLPAKVRYDAELPPNAKLLYAEITALAGENGYCWAQNSYLSKIFHIAPRTVSDLLGRLEKNGYVTIEIVRDTKTNQVLQRRIWIDDLEPPAAGNRRTPIAKICYRGIAKNLHTPIAKICAENNTSYEYNIPPISPMGDGCANTENTVCGGVPEKPSPETPREGTVRQGKADREGKTVPDWKPERFAGLWSFYPAKGRKNKQRAVKAWDKLRPDDELIAAIARALVKLKATDEWQRGVGIPYVATFLNGARWEDAESLDASAGTDGTGTKPGGWAEDEEVL